MGKATIGTISHGTLRTEDLVQAFSSELRGLVDGDSYAELLANADKWLDGIATPEGSDDEIDFEDEGSELVTELEDALQEYAPPYCYFGSTDGDGSDYGFWPSISNLEEDARDRLGDVVKANAGSEPSYMMSVNDHGNVTLYRIKLEEVWSVV